MAANMLPIRPICVKACAGHGHRGSDANGRKTSSNWWSPLFGWSAQPDYMESDDKQSETDRPQKPLVKPRFPPGSFTEDKAKQLRMMINETSTFHDNMYHSAIASRLASDFSNKRSDQWLFCADRLSGEIFFILINNASTSFLYKLGS